MILCLYDTKQTKASTHKGGGSRLAPKRQPGLMGFLTLGLSQITQLGCRLKEGNENSVIESELSNGFDLLHPLRTFPFGAEACLP